MDLDKLLEIRRTYRSFDEGKTISKEDAEKIIRAEKFASRGANRQTLRYAVVRNKDLVNKITDNAKWAGKIPNDKGRPQIGKRPVMYILVYTDNSAYSKVDAGLAISNMTLKAMDLNIGSCILAAINKKEISKLIQEPEGYELMLAIAFGYPAHKSEIIEAKDDKLDYTRDENGDYKVERTATERLFKIYE
ncbi:MAG: nitroreductase family protein [Tissierellia bacterium]|nr:nitroreductase family protein [Tissierellia bacterium]